MAEDNDMTFDEWWNAVKQTATRNNVENLLGDQESHREGFEDDYTPSEEVEETIYSAKVSM